jgi:hypothetical protein
MLAGGYQLIRKPGARLVNPLQFKFLAPGVFVGAAIAQFLNIAIKPLGNGRVDIYNVPTPMIRLPRHKFEKLVPFPVRR